ncbi:hypothetical protein ACFRCW_37340 [Streptomyces sp. NPDC056653]|uniref:hypothetical protein n=1 Tax=Streptomyces sp. NPDC056653 TaxID=3345894 RepID=UPI0036791008
MSDTALLVAGHSTGGAVTRAARIEGPDVVLTDEQVRAFGAEQLAAVDLDGKSVCVVVPDGTRSCPLPLLFSAVTERCPGG